MSRVPLVTEDVLTLEQRPVVDAILAVASRGRRIPAPYQLTLHCPELTDKWQQIGALLRYRTSLPLRISELAILITARHWNCDYEWYAHAPVARGAGIDEGVIQAIRHGKQPELGATVDAVIYGYCSDLLRNHFVNDATHRAVRDIFGVTGVIELTALIGYYVMVAMALNAHDYPLPADADERLPAL